MIKRIFYTQIIVVFLVLGTHGQTSIIADEFLKIKPHVSTREDVEKIYGKGEIAYKTVGFYKAKNRIIQVRYLVESCNGKNELKPESEWIVKNVFFVLEGKKSKRRLKHVILDRSKFRNKEYGDIVGQIKYYNKDKTIQITYFKFSRTVESMRILPTKEQKELYKYKCRSNKKETKTEEKK